MNKTKIKTSKDETIEDLPFAPPEMHYLSERYIVRVPVSDGHFENPWELRLYAAKILQRTLGDDFQLTSMRVKKPHIIAKSKAKLFKREPNARLFVTVKF